MTNFEERQREREREKLIRARLRKRANESKSARLIGYSFREQPRLSRRFSRISEASPPLMKLQRDIRRRLDRAQQLQRFDFRSFLATGSIVKVAALSCTSYEVISR